MSQNWDICDEDFFLSRPAQGLDAGEDGGRGTSSHGEGNGE